MIFQTLSKEFSLFLRNIQSRRGHFLPDKQQYFVLHDILPTKDFQQIRELLLNKKWLFIRQNSTIRKGSTIGGHELRNSPLRKLVEQIDCNDFLGQVQSRTAISDLQYVSEIDTNRLSLLSYSNAGDGIGWHIDGTIYLADRWAGILTIVEDMMITFTSFGEQVKQRVRIKIKEYRSGGIIFFRIGLDNLESKVSRIKSTPMEEKEAILKDGFAYTPFAIPFIAGPGSITSVIILSNSINNITDNIIFIFSMLSTLGITYIIFQTAGRVSKALGTIGIRILQRVMGLLLSVIAIQFIIDGIIPILNQLNN